MVTESQPELRFMTSMFLLDMLKTSDYALVGLLQSCVLEMILVLSHNFIDIINNIVRANNSQKYYDTIFGPSHLVMDWYWCCFWWSASKTRLGATLFIYALTYLQAIRDILFILHVYWYILTTFCSTRGSRGGGVGGVDKQNQQRNKRYCAI